MAIYQPKVEMFYGTVNSSGSKISPAPNMSINLNYDYAGESIVGYTYEIQLTGQITTLDLSNLSYGDTYTKEQELGSGAGGLGTVADKINKTRALLSQNGNILHITDAKTKTPFFKAKGGILRSFNIDNSNNNMSKTANFTAVIEFNEVEINDAQNSTSSFLDSTGFPNGANDKGIIDIEQFKIKSFTDSWSFSFNEEIHNTTGQIDWGKGLIIDNSFFTVEYNADATGKNYYNYSNDNNSTATLIPAWEQAKNFVQHRLYYQVTSLIGGILKTYGSTGCTSSDGLDNINVPNSAKSGGLLDSLEATYKVYNEEITCDYSESAGSFSANYKCIVRRNIGSAFSDSNVLHTITKGEKLERQGIISNKTVSINGRIEGLIPGGIVNLSKPLQLPATGSLLINQNMTSAQEKMNSAIAMKNKVISGNSDDLHPDLKSLLSIYEDLSQATLIPGSSAPWSAPSNFTLTHNYIEGTIDYTAEYDSNNFKCGTTTVLSYDIQESAPVFAVYDIPGSNTCGVLHKLGTKTAKRVSITKEGYDQGLKQFNLSPMSNLSSCGDATWPAGLPGFNTLIDNSYTINPITGKYTITATFYCLDDNICYI